VHDCLVCYWFYIVSQRAATVLLLTTLQNVDCQIQIPLTLDSTVNLQ